MHKKNVLHFTFMVIKTHATSVENWMNYNGRNVSD